MDIKKLDEECKTLYEQTSCGFEEMLHYRDAKLLELVKKEIEKEYKNTMHKQYYGGLIQAIKVIDKIKEAINAKS